MIPYFLAIAKDYPGIPTISALHHYTPSHRGRVARYPVGSAEWRSANDDRWSLIGSLVKIEDLTQVPLLRDGDQLFSRPLCTSPQFVEAWKSGEFLKSWGRSC